MNSALGNQIEFTSSQLISHINAIQQTSTLKELADIFAAPMGCTSAWATSIPPIGSHDRQNSSRYFHYQMPSEVLAYMIDEYSFVLDPVAKYVLDQGSAVWLSDLLDQTILIESGYDKIIQRLIGHVGDGMCIPCFHQSYYGYYFICFGRPKADFNDSLLWQTQIICQHYHVRYGLFWKLLKTKVNLTSRELDVIELVALGKTNPDIAHILGISANTVSSYVKNIYLKLDTTDRVTASLRAISLNLIS